MDSVRKHLSQRFPHLKYQKDDLCRWSPDSRKIHFVDSDLPEDVWALLHETGHALLAHHAFITDLELLQLEVDAWQKAKALATECGVSIDSDHIEDCLDTYRDWLYARSSCPACGTSALQDAHGEYQCFNCHKAWRVSRARFCRAYRSQSDFSTTYRSTF